MQQPRLSVGIISAGAVGTALAEKFLQAGHVVHGVVAPSDRSRRRAAERIPRVPVVSLEDAAQAALVIIAVPDPQLVEVIDQVAEVTRDGQIVAHTSGAHGCAVLQPVTDTGAIPLALHPVMTFGGSEEDCVNLTGCAWGITSDSEVGQAVAELLVASLDGVAISIPEDKRAAYHAAVAYAANYVVTLLSDAQRMLDYVLAEGTEGDGKNCGSSFPPPMNNPHSARLLRTIVPAAVNKAFDQRMCGMTGPVARDDAPAVLRHIDALRELEDNTHGMNFSAAYIPMAERTAQLLHSLEVERVLAEYTRRLR
ncbi:Rossmann-like and DUF2520 domain-containing protein [Corynebacterium anserum]|nr:DUF2520 domain-containing protein [Corynebacterium anserum]